MYKPLKLQRLVSILVVFFLLSTGLSTVVSSNTTILNPITNNTNEAKSSINKLLEGGSIKERLLSLREKLQNRISQIKNSLLELKNLIKTGNQDKNLKSTRTSVAQTFKSLLTAKNSSIMFYTNYSGIEKRTNFGLFKKINVDVNNDGSNDISAKMTILPFIEKPLCLSIRFKLTITRLGDFPDKNAKFSASAEVYFPGLISIKNKGDRVSFGYETPDDGEVPDSCVVTYKYVPHILSKEKPRHDVQLDPGSVTDLKNLTLFYSYANADGDVFSSEDTWRVEFSPAVKTEISLTGVEDAIGRKFSLQSSKESLVTIYHTKTQGGNTSSVGLIVDKVSDFSFEIALTPFSKGGSRIEYNRASSNPVDVTLFFEKDTSSYIYVDDLPQQINLSWIPEKDGLIELNTYGERATAIGIRNALHDEDATAKAYISDLPSLIQVSWNWTLLQGGELNVFTDVGGCSAHILTNDLLGTGAKLAVDIYTNENIDLSVFWNFTDKYFGIRRTNSSINISASLTGLNGTSVDFSCEIQTKITNPFIIDFDKTDKNGDLDIQFTGKELTISNLKANIVTPSLGNFAIDMDKLVISKESSIHFSFSVNKSENKTTVSASIEITNGMYIENISIWYNNSLIVSKDLIDVTGYWYEEFGLTIYEANIEWGGDAKNGYLFIHGGAGLTFTFNSVRKINGETIASASGSITFETDEGLNISWATNSTGNLTFNIVGGGSVVLSGFSFILNDKISLFVDKIIGRFNLDTKEKTGEIILLIDDGTANFDFNFNISIPNFKNVSFAANIHADIGVGLSGELIVSWNENGTTIEGNVEPGVHGELDIGFINFLYGEKSSDKLIALSAERITISGNLSFSLSFSSDNIDFVSDLLTSLNADSFNLLVKTPTIEKIVLDVKKFSLTGSGYLNIIANTDPKQKTFSITVYADGSVGLGLFNLSLTKNGITTFGELSFNRIMLDGQLMFDVDKDTISVSALFTVNRPFLIDAFYLNFNDLIYVSWEQLLLLVDGYGKISFCRGNNQLQSIYVDATIDRLYFTNFEFLLNKNLENGTRLAINGQVSVTSNGPLTIRGSVGGCTEPYFQVLLNNGYMDVDNLYISIGTISDVGAPGQGNKLIEAGWEKLHITGSFVFDLKVTKDNKNNKLINIGTSGKGGITLNNASITGNLVSSQGPSTFDIEIGYLNFELDDFIGSVQNISLNTESNKFSIESASASGSITHITIKDFYASFYNFDAGLFYVNLTDVKMNYSGSGKILFEFTEPDEEGIQTISLDGFIYDPNGYIFIDSLYLYMPSVITVDLKEFSLTGRTTFHLFAEGILYIDPEDLTKNLKNINLIAGCNSNWSASKIYIASVLGFDNFSGIGDISAGVELDLQDPYYIGNFVIQLNGSLSWDNLYALPTYNKDGDGLIPNKDLPPIGNGNFNGNLEFRIDLLSFLILFAQGIPLDPKIQVDANSFVNFNLNFLKLINISIQMEIGRINFHMNLTSDPIKIEMNTTSHVTIYGGEFKLGTDYLLSVGTVELHQGNFLAYFSVLGGGVGEILLQNTGTISPTFGLFNLKNVNTGKSITFTALSFSCPYLDLTWDINGDKQGSLGIDTNDLPMTMTLTIFNRLSITGGIKAQDFVLSWDFTHPLPPWFSYSGTIDFVLNPIVGVNVTGTWHYWPENLPDPPPAGEININMADQIDENQPFIVRLTDKNTGSNIVGGHVYYKAFDPNDGHLIYTSETKTTDNNGEAVFTAIDVFDIVYCTMYASATGYTNSEKDFIITGAVGEVVGYVKDYITHDPIPYALVVANPGGYNDTTRDVNPVGQFWLIVPPGTYTITASKTGYQQMSPPITLTVKKDDHILLDQDIYLKSTTCGYINGTIYDQNNNLLFNVDIYLDGVFKLNTGDSGKFSLQASPGTHDAKASLDHFIDQTKSVNVVAGQVTDVVFNLQREWYSPTGYSDPDSGWNNEVKAYDDNIYSCASSNTQLFQGWTKYLQLTITQLNCDKIRFNAFYNSEYCWSVDLDTYYSGSWHDVYQGAFANQEYVEKSLGGTYPVEKARIRFYIKGAYTTTADLYELDLHKA